ncbi:hypothetical protein IGI04_015521 [Brassica rapa subsp. trilocularis]|uniref:Uncharacterized protein n=1 Tax=Brassica rapa subsp. trilocularis TaxID=1813537 RepID=A0ABQ7MQB2_BRACM|nr:hypothetical protein IGI04_015521 [Brassica rapa subsp. trilocularis]
MGWVPNGVVGSPAFTAYDQVSGITQSTRHARDDIPAMIEKIQKIKTSEFRLYQPNVEEVVHEEQPYKLYVIYELWKAMLL